MQRASPCTSWLPLHDSPASAPLPHPLLPRTPPSLLCSSALAALPCRLASLAPALLPTAASNISPACRAPLPSATLSATPHSLHTVSPTPQALAPLLCCMPRRDAPPL